MPFLRDFASQQNFCMSVAAIYTLQSYTRNYGSTKTELSYASNLLTCLLLLTIACCCTLAALHLHAFAVCPRSVGLVGAAGEAAMCGTLMHAMIEVNFHWQC